MQVEPRIVTVDHPLARDKLTVLRDRTTDVPAFRRAARQLSTLVVYEAARGLPSDPVEIETPLASMSAERVLPSSVAVVAVLRAGLGMLDAALELVPQAT